MCLEILDSFVNGTLTAANTVTKKAKSAVEISRLKLNAVELKSEISKKYEALGRLVYESRVDSTDAEDMIAECIDNINITYRRLDEVNEKIATALKRRRCSSCGSINANDALYCNRCGKRMSEKKKIVK